MKKNSSFLLIRFSFLSISENKMVLLILPKKLTFRSEYLNFQVLTISSILVPLRNNIKFDFKHI